MSVGGTTIEILKSLEGQPLKKWDCPSEIGTVGNYIYIWTRVGSRGDKGAEAPPPPSKLMKHVTYILAKIRGVEIEITRGQQCGAKIQL